MPSGDASLGRPSAHAAQRSLPAKQVVHCEGRATCRLQLLAALPH